MFNYNIVQNLWARINPKQKVEVAVVFESEEEVSESDEITEVFADYWEDTEAVFAFVKEQNK